MPYELLNSAQVTPARLYALLRLVVRLKKPQREDIQVLLQPDVLFQSKQENEDEETGANSYSASRNVYLAARHCNLIEELPDNTIQVKGDVGIYLTSLDKFQTLMQQRVWNATTPEQNNYLLNLYSAWYIVQNERIFTFEDKDLETRFNEELFENADERTFNMTKFVGWRMWASFLGIGWSVKRGIIGNSREILAPNVSQRLLKILPLFSTKNGAREIQFNSFMQELAQLCPELDGGILFDHCRGASRGGEQYGDYLSLALSTGLRQLHNTKHIQLIRQPDAQDTWLLYPAEGLDINLKEVTHIKFLEQNVHGK
ncbi:hypothetical protein [Dictyobacter kobayashii]|uniref:Uncharacterized protein n=1 Tax=Dictyobacter kobayashii TaxID=2014872 RepID=A0A402AVW6_9CHLR|nr:hypothetical protein [Dictyobacter kobayashii]GCE23214.1 hypothetical protein KDK_70140 [Dictyobacter kobayashii]